MPHMSTHPTARPMIGLAVAVLIVNAAPMASAGRTERTLVAPAGSIIQISSSASCALRLDDSASLRREAVSGFAIITKGDVSTGQLAVLANGTTTTFAIGRMPELSDGTVSRVPSGLTTIHVIGKTSTSVRLLTTGLSRQASVTPAKPAKHDIEIGSIDLLPGLAARSIPLRPGTRSLVLAMISVASNPTRVAPASVMDVCLGETSLVPCVLDDGGVRRSSQDSAASPNGGTQEITALASTYSRQDLRDLRVNFTRGSEDITSGTWLLVGLQ